ncbi:uncharacterized protein LOC111103339 [Crassostrea virginica]
MARTKASVLSGEVVDKGKKTQPRKRKDSSHIPDTSKKKKIKKEEVADDESDGEGMSCDSLPEVGQQFHKGTTWPLDASLEVNVQYEGVKEARTVKQQFFPLLFHLTRGDPDSIAKAITAIKPVYKLLTERFEKEHKATASSSSCNADVKPADAAVPQQNRVLTQAEILRKIPHYRFRDSAGKWLPKSLWKKAEILKKKAKLQSLMSSMEFSQETKEITEFSDAKAAIENILSRISFDPKYCTRLLHWLRNLDMKSFGKQEKTKKPAEKEHHKKKEKKPEKKKKKEEAKVKKSDSVPKTVPHKALYGLEESAIISDKRLRNRPKFVPFIPPTQKTGKSKGKIQSSSPKKMHSSYTPQSAAMKKYVQQSGSYAQQSKSARSLNEKSGSSRGYSVVFKGRTFSSGKKMFFNRDHNSPSESDSESKYEESDSSSTASSYTQDSRKNVSRSLDLLNGGPKSTRTIMTKAHRDTLSENSSELGQMCENNFLSDSSENMDKESPVGKRDVNRVKSSCEFFPKARIPKLRPSDAKLSTSPLEERQGRQSVNVKFSDAHSQEMYTSVDAHSKQSEIHELKISEVKSLARQSDQSDVLPELLYFGDEVKTKANSARKESIGIETCGDLEQVLHKLPVQNTAELNRSVFNEEEGGLEKNTESHNVRVVYEKELPVMDLREKELKGTDGMANTQREADAEKEAETQNEADTSSLLVNQDLNEVRGQEESTPVVHLENVQSGNSVSLDIEDNRNKKQGAVSSLSSTSAEQVNHGELDNEAQIATSSTDHDKSKNSLNSPQPSTAEETLRLLISQLTNLTKGKGQGLDCRLVFSNSNQVLSIGEKSNGSQGELSVDIKPNVDELRLKENPISSTAGGSEIGGNAGGNSLNIEGNFQNTDSSDVRVKEEGAEPVMQWAGLRTQTEAEPIIIIDSDDE